MLSADSDEESRTKLDSHANMVVDSMHAYILNYKGHTAEVSPNHISSTTATVPPPVAATPKPPKPPEVTLQSILKRATTYGSK